MKKITELSNEQVLKMKDYVKKWTDIGLSTEATDRCAAERHVSEAYKIAGLESPKMIFWADSPLALPITLKLIRVIAKEGFRPYSEMNMANVWDNVWANVGANVWDNVWANVGANVWDNVRDNVRDNVWDNVWDNVGDNVRANVGANVRANVGANVWDNVWDNVGDNVREEWGEYKFDGQYDANWLAYYEYFSEVCGLDFCEKLRPLMSLSKEVGFCYFFKDIVILSEKPIEIHLNLDGRLHNNNGPAMKWKDGYELYMLNGVRMSKEQAMLRPEEMTKESILNEKNADIRREQVRKLSPERMVEILDPKIIDEKYGYKLLAIELGDNRIRPFLEMVNPSIETTHIEGIHPDCKTVEDAIKFRNGLEEFSLPHTLDGLIINPKSKDHQQGDCLFFPETMPSDAKICHHKIAGEGLIRHMIKNGEVYESNGIRYVLAFKDCEITHPEHRSTFLNEFVSYRVAKVLEFDHWLNESREVID